jgi:hypothetical protein
LSKLFLPVNNPGVNFFPHFRQFNEQQRRKVTKLRVAKSPWALMGLSKSAQKEAK